MPKKSGRLSGFPRRSFDLELRGSILKLGLETKIMGVLNVTPDSFSDGGAYLDPGRAEARALQMEAEGAHLIDIGGESTRPGARPVAAHEEIARVRPVLKRLAKKIKVPLSIDTMRSETAHAALSEGAKLVNDVSGLQFDPALARTAARHQAGLVLMHMKGSPQTMQKEPSYKDPVREIAAFLKKAVRRAMDAGVPRSALMIDPGFGFGKTAAHNFELLARLGEFENLGLPVLAGLSRKSFIGSVIKAGPDGRLYGSLAAGAAAVMRGAHMLRVHDVLAHAHMARILDRTAEAAC